MTATPWPYAPGMYAQEPPPVAERLPDVDPTAVPVYSESLPKGVDNRPSGRLYHHSLKLRAAAHHATRVLPHALGQLVYRELLWCADSHYAGPDPLVMRVADEVMAISTAQPAQMPTGNATVGHDGGATTHQ